MWRSRPLPRPASSAGAVALSVVGEVTLKLSAGVPPKYTTVAPARLVPEMVTALPPPLAPELGLTPLTVGAAAR